MLDFDREREVLFNFMSYLYYMSFCNILLNNTQTQCKCIIQSMIYLALNLTIIIVLLYIFFKLHTKKNIT
jgi:hypothetical protein